MKVVTMIKTMVFRALYIFAAPVLVVAYAIGILIVDISYRKPRDILSISTLKRLAGDLFESVRDDWNTLDEIFQ